MSAPPKKICLCAMCAQARLDGQEAFRRARPLCSLKPQGLGGASCNLAKNHKGICAHLPGRE